MFISSASAAAPLLAVFQHGAVGPARGGKTEPSGPQNEIVDEVDFSPEAQQLLSNLTPEQEAQVQKLKARDQEVRAHEQAHLAAAGPYATGGPSYTYQKGPDGQRYAIGGEVQIDTSPVEGDPEATLRKAQIVRAAALAPAKPSSQDRAVAASASQMEAQALAELQKQNRASAKAVDESDSGFAAEYQTEPPEESTFDITV